MAGGLIGLRLALAALLAAALGGCGQEAAGPNVILIGIDTLRADALGAYGAEGDPSPNLDAVAGAGSVFEQATTAASWTLPSFASILTGLYPEAHGTLEGGDRLADSYLTVAELLGERGYRTGAFSSSGYVGPRFGLAQGFEEFDAESRTHKFAEQLPAALDWIDAGEEGRPFLLFLHGYDVHVPYAPRTRPDPPPGYAPPSDELAARVSELVASERPSNELPVGAVHTAYLTLDPLQADRFRRDYHRWTARLGDLVERLWEREPTFEADLAWVRANYDQEVREMDADLARLFQHLAERGLDEETLIVIVSDHGEAFMEHGDCEHETVRQEIAHVPLIVRPPTAPDAPLPAGRVPQPVSTVDIVPTILDYCAAPLPGWLQGRSLRPLIEGDELPEVPVFCHRHVVSPPQRTETAVRFKQWKLRSGGKLSAARVPHRLHDLASDPGESRNLYLQEPEIAQRLKQMLDEHRQQSALLRAPHDTERADLDEETLRELAELGYLGGGDTDD